MTTRSSDNAPRNVQFWPVVAALLLFGCADGASTGQAEREAVTSAPLLLASASVGLPAGMSAADLPDPESAGAQLVAKYCSVCHAVSSPTTHAANDWPVVMRRMWLRTEYLGPEFNVPIPTSAERLAMLNYMRDNALQVSSSLPDGLHREVFVQQCGQCHDLPDPRQHSAEDWVAVVQRMSGRMETILERELDPQDFTRIVLYLESASRGAR